MHYSRIFPASAGPTRRLTPCLRVSFALIAVSLMALLALSLSSPAAHAQTYSEQTVYPFTNTTTDGGAPSAGLLAVKINGIETLYGTTIFGGTYNEGTVFAIDPTTGAETTLHSFGASGDGAYALASLTLINGMLYGVAELGGMHSKGLIFSVDPATGAEKICYSFAGNLDGAYPRASLVDVNGILYGTTFYGGSNTNSVNGNGTIFSFNPTNMGVNPIYLFQGGTTDGANPVSGLLALNGILYGTTLNGGTSVSNSDGTTGEGTVFSLDPATKIETILHTFTGATLNHDGSVPQASLIEVNGILYGTTETGGRSDYGTVFSIKPNGDSYLILYSFTDALDDGASPFASLTYDSLSGKFFGTTYSGGHASYGTVFSWDRVTQKEATIYSFTPLVNKYYNTDGARPSGSLVDVGGTLYGTAYLGGTSGGGTVFSLTPVTPPIAKADGCTIKYNTARTITAPGVLANDNAGGAATLTATLISNPTHGSLTLGSDGSFTYTPTTGYVGGGSFTYQAVNSAGHSNTATVTLTVTANAPITHTDGCTIKYNQSRTITAPGILANDDAQGGGTLTAQLVSSTTHGSLTFHSDGSFVYTPNTGYAGTDTFTYKAVNSVGAGNAALVTLTIPAIAPIAHNDGLTIKHNQARTASAPGVLGNDETGGSPTTCALVANPTHGTVTLHTDGSFTYTPTTGFSGTDTFTYKDTNAVGTSNTATVTLTVQ